jgi:hypothetical protein
MKQMGKRVPDAGSYAPVTILISAAIRFRDVQVRSA